MRSLKRVLLVGTLCVVVVGSVGSGPRPKWSGVASKEGDRYVSQEIPRTSVARSK